MRITSISVMRLFGMFDHTIKLNRSEKITIVYGPNGYGKTYLLRAVNDLFCQNFENLSESPFSVLTVTFEDGRRIDLKRPDDGSQGISKIVLTGTDDVKRELTTVAFTDMFAGVINVRFINAERLMQYSDTERDRPVIIACAEKMQALLAEAVTETTRRKIDFLASIVNDRFRHKKIIIDPASGFYFTTATGMKLRPEQLSSGEQHAVIILFELLFTIAPETLILIDEPELSLHIFWQQQFIRDLEKILEFGDYDILIATHSPQIIHDRWDLTVELRGPEE
jgi:predicted ATP-binding protein involved in virulence